MGNHWEDKLYPQTTETAQIILRGGQCYCGDRIWKVGRGGHEK